MDTGGTGCAPEIPPYIVSGRWSVHDGGLGRSDLAGTDPSARGEERRHSGLTPCVTRLRGDVTRLEGVRGGGGGWEQVGQVCLRPRVASIDVCGLSLRLRGVPIHPPPTDPPTRRPTVPPGLLGTDSTHHTPVDSRLLGGSYMGDRVPTLFGPCFWTPRRLE